MRVQQSHASVGGMMVTMVCVLYPRPNYHSRLLNIHSQAWTTVYIPEAKWAADEEAPAELRAANTSLRGTVPLHFNTVVSAAECLGTLACKPRVMGCIRYFFFEFARCSHSPLHTHTNTVFPLFMATYTLSFMDVRCTPSRCAVPQMLFSAWSVTCRGTSW